MAKTYRLSDPPVGVVFTSMSTRERVHRAHARRVASLVGFTTIPRMTREMKKDIEMGRPVINQ